MSQEENSYQWNAITAFNMWKFAIDKARTSYYEDDINNSQIAAAKWQMMYVTNNALFLHELRRTHGRKG